MERMFERVRTYLSPVRETNDAHPHYRIKMSHLLGLFGATLDGCLAVSALDAGEAGPPRSPSSSPMRPAWPPCAPARPKSSKL